MNGIPVAAIDHLADLVARLRAGKHDDTSVPLAISLSGFFG
jgi:hypothetical protein